MNRDSFLSQSGQDVFVRWWDPRIGNASSHTDDQDMPRPTSQTYIPDMDDVLHGDDVLEDHYPMPPSSRSDSLSSASTSCGPATPNTPPSPLWPGTVPGTSKRPAIMHGVLPLPKERRRPSSVSSSTSSMASRVTTPRSILTRNNSVSTSSAMGSRARRTGGVTFADRPQVLSCKYEVDEEDASEIEFGVRPHSLSYTSPLPSSQHLPTLVDADETPRASRTRGREKEKSLFSRLRSALSPTRSPSSDRHRRTFGDMGPPSTMPSNSGRSAPASISRASTSRARSHDEPPVIGRPQPLQAHSSPYGQDGHFGPGDARSMRSTRSAASLRSTTSVHSQDERKRGGLKSLLGLFR